MTHWYLDLNIISLTWTYSSWTKKILIFIFPSHGHLPFYVLPTNETNDRWIAPFFCYISQTQTKFHYLLASSHPCRVLRVTCNFHFLSIFQSTYMHRISYLIFVLKSIPKTSFHFHFWYAFAGDLAVRKFYVPSLNFHNPNLLILTSLECNLCNARYAQIGY